MKISDSLDHPATWQSHDKTDLSGLTPHAIHWITNPDSLTQRLRRHTKNRIQHQLLFANWGQPYRDETDLIGVKPHEKVWVRQIDWVNHLEPWVSARVVIPSATLNTMGASVIELGSHSLGDVLFSSPEISRAAFEFCQLPLSHPLFQQARSLNPTLSGPLFARRSVFHVKQQPLLVTEVFLPALMHQPIS